MVQLGVTLIILLHHCFMTELTHNNLFPAKKIIENRLLLSLTFNIKHWSETRKISWIQNIKIFFVISCNCTAVAVRVKHVTHVTSFISIKLWWWHLTCTGRLARCCWPRAARCRGCRPWSMRRCTCPPCGTAAASSPPCCSTPRSGRRSQTPWAGFLVE